MHVGSQSASSLADEVKVVTRAIAILCGVIVCGTIGFYVIESDWTLWRSFYLTLITITTVGYGDEGMSEGSEVFAAVLLISGLGTATWALSTVVQFAVVRQFDWSRKMRKRVRLMQDHIIICGFGRIGQTLCEELMEAGIPFVIVDKSTEAVAEAVARKFVTLQGDTTEEAMLIEAGLDRARGLVSCVNSDAENIMITLTARDLNPALFIATRANSEASVPRLKRAGSTYVVSPYTTAGYDIARAISEPHLAELLRTAHRPDGDFALTEICIEPNSILTEATPATYGQTEESIAFIAIRRDGSDLIFRPAGQKRFLANDVLIAAGKTDAMARMAIAARTPIAIQKEAPAADTNQCPVASLRPALS